MHSFVSLRELNSLIAASLRELNNVIAASPQASSTLIFVCPVVPWVSCRYVVVRIFIFVCRVLV